MLISCSNDKNLCFSSVLLSLDRERVQKISQSPTLSWRISKTICLLHNVSFLFCFPFSIACVWLDKRQIKGCNIKIKPDNFDCNSYDLHFNDIFIDNHLVELAEALGRFNHDFKIYSIVVFPSMNIVRFSYEDDDHHGYKGIIII